MLALKTTLREMGGATLLDLGGPKCGLSGGTAGLEKSEICSHPPNPSKSELGDGNRV
jgi:hypothetical protein